MSKAHDGRQDQEELRRAADVLERAVQFLERCAQEPPPAAEPEERRDLLQELRSLSITPASDDPSRWARRKRRSA